MRVYMDFLLTGFFSRFLPRKMWPRTVFLKKFTNSRFSQVPILVEIGEYPTFYAAKHKNAHRRTDGRTDIKALTWSTNQWILKKNPHLKAKLTKIWKIRMRSQSHYNFRYFHSKFFQKIQSISFHIINTPPLQHENQFYPAQIFRKKTSIDFQNKILFSKKVQKTITSIFFLKQWIVFPN